MYRHLAAEADPHATTELPRNTFALIAMSVVLIVVCGVALIVYGEKSSENAIQYIIAGGMVMFMGFLVGVYALVLYARR